MNSPSSAKRTLLLVACAAPPATDLHELIPLLQQDGWDVHVVTTPTAASWVDSDQLTTVTGHPVHVQVRRPDEPKSLPRADAIAVVPATFNTINQWAVGINDTLALGILNEALGGPLPIIAAPYAKPALTSHPAFSRNLEFLRQAGVRLTETDAIRPPVNGGSFKWQAVVDLLREHTPREDLNQFLGAPRPLASAPGCYTGGDGLPRH